MSVGSAGKYVPDINTSVPRFGGTATSELMNTLKDIYGAYKDKIAYEDTLKEKAQLKLEKEQARADRLAENAENLRRWNITDTRAQETFDLNKSLKEDEEKYKLAQDAKKEATGAYIAQMIGTGDSKKAAKILEGLGNAGGLDQADLAKTLYTMREDEQRRALEDKKLKAEYARINAAKSTPKEEKLTDFDKKLDIKTTDILNKGWENTATQNKYRSMVLEKNKGLSGAALDEAARGQYFNDNFVSSQSKAMNDISDPNPDKKDTKVSIGDVMNNVRKLNYGHWDSAGLISSFNSLHGQDLDIDGQKVKITAKMLDNIIPRAQQPDFFGNNFIDNQEDLKEFLEAEYRATH